MKARTNILTHAPTSTAPIAAFIARLCAGVVAGLNNGGDSRLDGAASRAVLRAAQRTRRAVRDYCRAEFAAHQRRLKLAMLGHKHWRRLVLKELGGALALARWGAAMKRCKLRREAWASVPKLEPAPRAWRKTPEMMAQELRLKAHARACAKACAPSYISRDPCTMDKSGQFRLPPLPRLTGSRNPDAVWTTPFDLGDYRYDATPVTRRSGYNAPILIWPEEFEVAELWDYQRWLRERCSYHTQTTSISLSSRALNSCSAKNTGTGDYVAGGAPRGLIPYIQSLAVSLPSKRPCRMPDIGDLPGVIIKTHIQDTAYEHAT